MGKIKRKKKAVETFLEFIFIRIIKKAKMKKGINLSDTILSEEDKKKAEELAKPTPELTPEEKAERKAAKKEKKKQNAEKNSTAKEPYIITLFKIENKPGWRMTAEREATFIKPPNMTEIKTIKIDRTTGEII